MDTVDRFAVGAELLRSNARLARAQPLPADVWIAQWDNADTEASYVKPGHHTLSMYLAGGHAVRCHQAPSARGEPGSLCLLPADHESHWDVNGSLRLLHIYLPRLHWAQTAERWFDLDPRCAALDQRIFFHDDTLAALCLRIAQLDWQAGGATLQLQQLVLDVQARLVGAHTVHRARTPDMRGGLSPAARRRVLDHIEARLADRIELAELASAACLSEFHFARMFKATFGVAPHAWVMQRRLERARQLLAAGRLPLDQVALRCGYTHLSHLNAALKRAGLPSASAVRSPAAR
jgi:AraC family transcriptional regulator